MNIMQKNQIKTFKNQIKSELEYIECVKSDRTLSYFARRRKTKVAKTKIKELERWIEKFKK